MNPLANPTSRSAAPGFALITTLSLLILLIIIAVGLISLSSITLRSSSQSMAMNTAQANARVSLQMAIGQLQSLAGQDTRITAPRLPEDLSAPLDSLTPVTGVWRSWEGSDHESDGRPIVPDYASKKISGDVAAPPGAGGSGRFLGWLTSAGAWDTPEPNALLDLASDPTDGFVPLVSDGSVKEPKRRVFVKPTPTINQTGDNAGAIAWWTSGENSKILIAPDQAPATVSTTDWQQRARAHALPSPKQFGFNDPPKKPAVSLRNLELAATDRAVTQGNFHDITVWSSGLLTNAATGGWKRDLSLMTEKWGELPTTQLPFFTLRPGQDLLFSKAAPAQTSPSDHPSNPLLYGWCNYGQTPSSDTKAQFPAIVSWDYLRNACTQYRSIIGLNPTTGRTGIPRDIRSWWTDPAGGQKYRYEYIDRPRRWPALSRIYLMFSYVAKPDPANSENRKAALVMAPVVVVWNPYNHEINIEKERKFNINTVSNEITPARFSFTVGTDKQNPTSLYEIMKSNLNIRLNGGLGAEALTLRPGETRIFSVKNDFLMDGTSLTGTGTTLLQLDLYPGYRNKGGFYFTKIGPLKKVKGGTERTEISAPKESDFKVDLTFDALIDYDGKKGYGSMLDVGYYDPGKSAISTENNYSRRSSRQYLLFSSKAAAALWPPIPADQLPSCKLSDFEDPITKEPRPEKLFLTAVIGFRTANDSMIRSKGYLQSNPLSYVSDLADTNSAKIPASSLSGIQHPANSCYDIQFINGGQVDAKPNWENGTNRGYIVSGLDASSGVTSCVSAEIPTRPLQSLVELQGLDLRNCNPFPPFQFNIFGNSQAHPMLSADSAVLSSMQHDDAYCLNHVFFDDWFVSSIAPDLKDWTSQTERGLDVVYKDFLSYAKDPTSGSPLPNNMFRPTAEAMIPDTDSAYSRDVQPADSYRHIASKLYVDGMFNVNSTSVAAWRALLGHALGQRQPYLTESGGTWSVSLAPKRDHAVSRMSVAGGGAAGIDPPAAGANPDGLEFSGHRALTAAQLDALAEEIVRQIRMRGPFLSLSEFINRRLSASSSEEELALAGAVEAALSVLAKRGTSDPLNPYRELQKNSREITQATVAAMPAQADAKYLFPRAAEGWTANALPGWIRQADILRPLAPVLSVRDDVFVIRAYGDARDAQGNITASAWCEAIIQRNPKFVDSSDSATDTPVLGTDSGTEKFLQSAVNERFGRLFTIVSFRWLNPNEV